uniref:Putative secreted protein n=1 Tax=Anopheles marajoara TaxID=58244 RepID=A0A2M4CAZ3_9DIPT
METMLLLVMARFYGLSSRIPFIICNPQSTMVDTSWMLYLQDTGHVSVKTSHHRSRGGGRVAKLLLFYQNNLVLREKKSKHRKK